ncbi:MULTISPECIES: hypothetical protein [Burkholderia]|uniref:hypothetical protein n=1 Tax=Burkholderia TaxID=32008 RepID=UPI0015837DD4|nr:MULTISPECIES: hypothetical protein [Burkholderia]
MIIVVGMIKCRDVANGQIVQVGKRATERAAKKTAPLSPAEHYSNLTAPKLSM